MGRIESIVWAITLFACLAGYYYLAISNTGCSCHMDFAIPEQTVDKP